MTYFYFKALHLVFMVSWFAALFYLPRLFIYHVESMSEANELVRQKLSGRFKLMQRRLWYIIGWPAAILTLGFGISMLVVNPSWLKQPWMHMKLGMLSVLVLYHLQNQRILGKLQKDQRPMSSTALRLWNEVATILLIAIVFVAVLRDALSWIWGVLGILLMAGALTVAVFLYKKRRKKKESAPDE